jgi:phospholipid N-methyltransferase
MPKLNSPIYINQLEQFRQLQTLEKAMKFDVFGIHWGDPDVNEELKIIRDMFVLRYINSGHNALEIGPGGGRWTKYLLGFRKLYVVDYYPEMFEELKKNYNETNMIFIKNNGTNFPSIKEGSIDYLFSFGTFVHLDTDLIEQYLESMKSIVKPGANIVIQYSDKNKIIAQKDHSFSENTPDKMRNMVSRAGYKILEEDLTTLPHSSVMRFTL